MSLDNILIRGNENEISLDYLEKKFDKIFEDIDRIRNIINHVRLFSKDQDVGEFEKVNVNEVIHKAISMIKIQYTNHNVDLILNLEKNLFTYGNKYKLEQVILNLLSNAKYAVDEKKKSPGMKISGSKFKLMPVKKMKKLFLN